MAKKQSRVKVLDQVAGKDWQIFNGDSVEVVRGLPDNSIDLTITSPPFCNLYTYSPSPRDMGNTADDAHFFENFRYLIPELLRVTTPGRLCVVHCKDLPLFMGSDGVAGLRDFPGEIIKAFVGEDSYKTLAQIEVLQRVRDRLYAADADDYSLSILDSEIAELNQLLVESQNGQWVFHSRVTIWKCPKIERERTNNSGLLHGQLCKDSSASRQGMADYLLVFRKWAEGMEGLNSAKPVTRSSEWRFDDYIGDEPPYTNPDSDRRNHSIHVWRKYASPVWFDIQMTNVLNTEAAKNGDEPHMCPLQLDVIQRCLSLWSNPNDVIFDPFNGLASTGVEAVRMGRKYIGIELKPSYFEIACKNMEALTNSAQLDFALIR